MNIATLGLAATIALSGVGLATAQSEIAEPPATLEDLQAHRVDAGQVQVTFSYDGGACEEVDPAELGEAADGKLSLTFPTTSTAEICTMQVVTIKVDQAIVADGSVAEVDVTLLATDGSVAATGTAPISAE
ncbi:MAG: hypothetical protein WBA73_14775 [Devosia sp.]